MFRRLERASSRGFRAFAVASAIGASALVVAGCAASDAAPAPTTAQPSPTATSSAPSPDPSAEPGGVVAAGDAGDNLAIFRDVVETVWASEQRASGRAYIDGLVEVGFDKAAMQVTQDVSTVGNAAESLQFSVLWGEECLIGQVGPATGEPVAVVVDALPEGGCLVGTTRTIDW
ncbi:DUF6993 domain-containing protein [Microbacterium koreense]|uniref:DUF6993 domain-containing protein n=1 Tax=Microbacterium koreense TaxID=323761 RepID=A0ABW2ZSV4_9MICO